MTSDVTAPPIGGSGRAGAPVYTYTWAWGQPADTRTRRAGVFDRDRKGEACRVLARGPMNSALVEFESDGWRVVTSRNGLRRAV
jgi:hypothetical protein